MRGVGTAVNGVYPGHIRRINEGGIVGLGGQPITLWYLSTKETAAQVESAGYLNAWAADLPLGTPIIAAMDVDGTPKIKNYIVSVNTGTAVTIALQTTTAG